MTVVGSLIVQIQADVSNVNQQLAGMRNAFTAAFAAVSTLPVVGGLRDAAQAAYDAQVALEAWNRTLIRSKTDQDAAAATVQRLSERFGIAKESIYGAAEVLVRNKADLKQIELLYTAVAASALKAGKPVAEAWEQVSIAVATGRSELVEQYGLITNFGPAMDRYAKSIGKTADELTDQERVTANIIPLLQETQAEVADVDLYLQGYTKTTSDNTNAQKALQKAIGEAVLPAVTAFTQASTQAMNTATAWINQNRGELIPTLGRVAVAVFDAGNGIMMFAQLAVNGAKYVATAVGGIATVLVGLVATVTGSVAGIIAATVGGIREAISTATDVIGQLKAAKDAALSGDFNGALGQVGAARDRVVAGAGRTLNLGKNAVNVGANFGVNVVREGAADVANLGNMGQDAMNIMNTALNRSEAFRGTVDKTTAAVLKFGTATAGTVAPLKAMNDATSSAADKKKKEAEAAKKSAAEKEKERQATEANRIAFDKWKDSLKNATTAQLKAAQARAEANKDYDRWRALTSELERREEALTATTKKATAERAAAAKKEADERAAAAKKEADARKAAAQEIVDAQQNILKANRLEAFERAARNASSARLAQLLKESFTAGDEERYGIVRDVLRDRADARAQADRDFAAQLAEGERAGIDALNEVLSDPAQFATGIDRAGLPDAVNRFDELFDSLLSLRDELNTPGIAQAFTESLEEAARQGGLTAAQLQTLRDVVIDLNATPDPQLGDNLQGRGVMNEPDALDAARGILGPGERDALIEQMDTLNLDEIGQIYADLVIKGYQDSELGQLIADYLNGQTQAIDAALQEAGVSFGPDGTPVFQADAEVRGQTPGSGDGDGDFFDLGAVDVSAYETIDALQAVIDQAGLTEDAAQSLREQWQAQNAALLDLVLGYDEAGNAIYATDAQVRGIGVSAEETSEEFFDLQSVIDNFGSMSRAELEALMKAAGLTADQVKKLREEYEKLAQTNLEKLTQGFTKLSSAISGVFKSFGATGAAQITDGIGQIGSSILALPDAIGKVGTAWGAMKTGFSAASLGGFLGALGGAVGVIGGVIDGVINIGNAIEDMSGSIREWKKSLREVAQEQQKALGLSTGGIKSPWQDALKADAAARDKLANSKWYERLAWGIFGGAPQAMKTESAKALAEMQTIFAGFAEGFSGILTNTLTDAFNKGDMAGWAENFSKSFDAQVGQLILKTIIQAAFETGAAANDLGELTKAVKEERYGDIPPILTRLKATAGGIGANIAAIAPSLPGYGAGADDNGTGVPGGSLFGNAPTAQLGIPRFEVSFPEIALRGLTDFTNTAVPAFTQASNRMYEAAEMIIRANGGLQRTSGVNSL